MASVRSEPTLSPAPIASPWMSAGMPYLIKEVLYAPPCPEPVALLFEVALIHQNNGNYNMAIKTYMESQICWEDIIVKEMAAEGKEMAAGLAPDLPLIGMLYTRLAVASVFDSAANDERALAELMEAQRLCNDLPHAHPIQALIDSMIGVVYIHLSQYDIAADHFVRCLETRENILGKSHVDTGLVLNNIGVCLHYFGRTSDALVLYYRAEEIFIDAFKIEHPRTITVSRNISKAKHSYLSNSTFSLPEAKSITIQLCPGRMKALRAQNKSKVKRRKK